MHERSPRRKLLICLLATNLLSATMTRTAKADCPDVLAKCDAALGAVRRELQICDLQVQVRDEHRDVLIKENTQLRERSGAWYSNPFVFAALGVIAGTFIGARATR
jgi:hypothetical protein